MKRNILQQQTTPSHWRHMNRVQRMERRYNRDRFSIARATPFAQPLTDILCNSLDHHGVAHAMAKWLTASHGSYSSPGHIQIIKNLLPRMALRLRHTSE